MARIRLALPEKFNFSTSVKVRVTDLNYGGHLGNDALLSIIHEARVRFLQSLGFSDEMNVGGQGLIMSDVAIIFKSEGFHNDQLKIEVAVADFTRIGCDFFYRISNEKTGKEVVHAKTGIVFFDYRQRKMVAVPETFKDAIKDLL